MKNVKIILAILGFIGIGFLIGFYTHRTLSMQRIERVARMRSPEGFKEGFYQRIQASDAQRRQIEPILTRYGRAMGESHREWRENWHVLIDSMHQEIIPLLNEEQARELQEFNRRFNGKEDRDRSRKRDKRK